MEDAVALFGPGERPLAYVLGWMTHLVGDGLIKSIWPGVTLNLLDGKYTPRNRPIQDLFTYHEIGRKELQLNWPALLADVAETPVEPIQLHYMRSTSAARPTRPRLPRRLDSDGRRAAAGGPRGESAVLAESIGQKVLQEMQLERTDDGWQCREELRPGDRRLELPRDDRGRREMRSSGGPCGKSLKRSRIFSARSSASYRIFDAFPVTMARRGRSLPSAGMSLDARNGRYENDTAYRWLAPSRSNRQ